MIRPYKLLVVDVMDTLIHDPWREALQAASGLPIARLNQCDFTAWRQFEQALVDEAAYWRDLERQGVRVEVARFHTVRRLGYRWLPGAKDWLHSLQAAGSVIVLVTNYPVWLEEVRATLLADSEVSVYASYQIGARKPAPAFFAPLLADYHATMSDLLLVDDDPINVETVIQAGGQGIVHRTIAATSAALQGARVLAT